MKLLSTFSALIALALVSTPAAAACPAYGAGNTAAEIKANEQRVLCLQRELADQGERRRLGVEIDNINRNMQNYELQRRFDSLDFTIPTVP